MDYNTPQFDSSEPKTKSIGALIGIFVVLILIIVGGLYFWGKKANTKETASVKIEETVKEDLSSIEADLQLIDEDTSVTDTMTEINTDLK